MISKPYIKSCVPSVKKIAFHLLYLLAVIHLDLCAQVKRVDAAAASRRRIPAKAALYSAVLPGLGQTYNRKYWKIPIVYALIGTSVYFIKDGNDKYRRLRDAFITRINGGDDEFKGILTPEQIARGADHYEEDKNLAILFTGIFYALNILDALVGAHLSVFDADENLFHLAPVLFHTPDKGVREMGIGLCLRF